MHCSRILFLLVLMVALALAACIHKPPVVTPPDDSEGPQRVEVTSRLRGTVAGAGQTDLIFVGTAAHNRRGLQVIFTAKELVLRDPGNIGPITINLDPRHESLGTLSSGTFPATHRQDFFLRIQSERLGTLVSDDPVTLSAEIQSSPPRATYKSTSQPVAFYRQGDSDRKPVLTIESVESDVTPAARPYKK